MTKSKFVAVDWAHEECNLAVFDGKTMKTKLPPPKAGQVIVAENLPVKMAKPYLDAGIKVFRCNTNEVAKVREAEGIEKTHENDVRIIHRLYAEQPDLFRELTVDPVWQQFKALHATFKGLQRLRIATANRLYADDDAAAEAVLIGIEKQEAEVLKALDYGLKQMPIYNEFLVKVPGIGPATAAGLLAYVGDVNRFPTLGKLQAYFGLHVVDGLAPRREKGKTANWHHRGKSLLLGIIGELFVKTRAEGYRDIYDAEKAKQLDQVEKSGHAHRRANRKAVKAFVRDFYSAYKRLGRGEPVLKKFDEGTPKSKARKSMEYKARKKAEKAAAKKLAAATA